MLRSRQVNKAAQALAQASRQQRRALTTPQTASTIVNQNKKAPSGVRTQATTATAYVILSSPPQPPDFGLCNRMLICEPVPSQTFTGCPCASLQRCRQQRQEPCRALVPSPVTRNGRVVRSHPGITTARRNTYSYKFDRFIGKTGGEIFHEMMLRRGVKHICTCHACRLAVILHRSPN